MRTLKLAPLCLLAAISAHADMEHQKNTLIGGRAATMGGAYTAISDDASGAFHNPAGLAWATTSSFSGSANAYSTSNTVYDKAIDNQDWRRDSANLKPNFFGVVQKFKKSTFAFSYALTDSKVEHQDQIWQGLTGTVDPIDVYVLNLHTEDNTYLVGPSWSTKLNDKTSIGASLFYHYRVYRRAQSQLLQYTDGDDEASYNNLTKKEKGLRPKIGFMFSPKDKWSFGATLAKTELVTALTDAQENEKAKGASVYSFAQVKSGRKRRTPVELETGVAYFPNAFMLVSANLDYAYFADDSTHDDVINLSLGAEWFLSEKHAFRGGLFTNRTNIPEPTRSSRAREHIDLYGLTAGYTMYSQQSSVTFGTIASRGEGKAQIYTGSGAEADVTRTTLDFLISADYGF